MDIAPVADTEPQRLAALRSTGLLESPPDPAFDELVNLTARLLGVPIAAFNLVDADRQWTKSGFGMDNGDQAPRADSFCAHAIARDDGPLVVPDTAADPQFADNAMGLGFYAGTPVTAGGQRIGTLCVAGEQAHELRADEVETLRVLASAITAHVELSRRERERVEETDTLRRLGDVTSRLARVSDAAELETELCAAACELVAADASVLWTAVPGGNLVASVDVGLGIAGSELPPGHGAGSRVAFDRGEREYRTHAGRHRPPGLRRCRAPAAGDRRPGGGRPLGPVEERAGGAARARVAAARAALERGGGRDRAHDDAVRAREAHPRGRADRDRQPARVRRAAGARAQALRARGQRRGAGDVRPRPLQELQRHLRAPGGRPPADRGRRRLAGLPARHRQPGPLRRRGVRADRARLHGGRRRRRWSTACARP